MSNRFRVVIADFLTPGDIELEKNILHEVADVVALHAFDEVELEGRIESADAIMLYHSLSLTRKTIESLSNCKLIVRCGVGVDNIDRVAARQRGIPVANVPDYGTEEVADSAIGMMLALTRGITPANSMLQNDPKAEWTYRHIAPLKRLRGQVFAIIGCGRIGTAAAMRAKAFGMDVVFFDPYLADGFDKAYGIRRAESLNELLEQAYVLSAHCPLTPETKGMVNAETIARMPRGSYLVNTARGAIVDTSAIPEAIANGRLAGAGIDVLATEPPTADDPLIRAWRDPKHPAHHRVIINPHSAFYADEGLLDMRIKGSQACLRALKGTPLRNVVN